MRILVTGSAGFLGRYLVRQLIKQNHFVIGLDLNHDDQASQFIQKDLRDINAEEVPVFDLVIHLASNPGGILHNHTSDSLPEYELSLLKSLRSLMANHRQSKVIYFSSVNVFESVSCCYEGKLHHWSQITPYAQAKAGGEKFVAENFESYLIVRPTNIFGKEQSLKSKGTMGESHVIPELLFKIANHDTLNVWGDGLQCRNFIHASDVARFVCEQIHFNQNQCFNLRSELLISIGELAGRLLEFSGQKKQVLFEPKFLKFETRLRYDFDLTPVLKTGWAPQVKSIEEGLQF